MQVYVMTIEHKHGSDSRVFRSEESALAALAAWAREWWPDESARFGPGHEYHMDPAAFAELPDGAALAHYFDAMDGYESYDLQTCELED